MKARAKTINTYRPKSLIDGPVIKQEQGTSWVAVPDKFAGKQLKVVYGGATMLIKDWKSEAIMYRRFRDKFWQAGSDRPQFYTLGYFKFTPEEF